MKECDTSTTRHQRLTPLTRRRWQQFYRNRRARISLMLLVAIYLTSLAAELICNDQPLYVRFAGRNYFPFMHYVAQDTLLKDGVMARPDYTALRQSPLFAAASGNRIVMAPIPYGPHRVETPAALEPYRRARIAVTPVVALGRLDLTPAGVVTRSVGCDTFLPSGVEPDGIVLADYWKIPAALETALAMRLAGAAAPACKVVLQPHDNTTAKPVQVSLLARTAQEPAPSVRLALREPERVTTSPETVRLKRHNGQLVPLKSAGWHRFSEQERVELLEWAATMATTSTAETAVRRMEWAGREAHATFRFDSISWPHRPVPGHWLGIDAAGRDVLARLLYGTRIALTFGLLLVVWAMLLGLAIGAVQGYFGGLVDLATQRFIEIWSALPFLYVMILLGAVLGRSFGLLLLCYGLFNWIGLSYYMRAEFLRLRRYAFVEAAHCQGVSPLRIIWRHILPNALTPLITLLPFSLVGAIGAITALDFLGFGLPPLTPSWGELLQQAQQNRTAWWLILYPSLTLFSVMLLTVFIGEGLREAFDPKSDARYR